ncbi:MAG: biotin/lipoyl-containing protein [Bacillota bacterium]
MKNKEQIELKCPWLVAEEGTAEVGRWLVAEAETVEIDQDILVMLLDGEEFLLPSPVDGTIISLLVEPGDPVGPEQALAIIELTPSAG